MKRNFTINRLTNFQTYWYKISEVVPDVLERWNFTQMYNV